MKHRTIHLLVVLAAVSLFSSRARAEPLVSFDYSWAVQPSAVLPGGTGSVTLATAADGSSQAELGSANPAVIPAATVTTSSSATTVPDVFNTSYSMVLTLKDGDSGTSGTLTFAGTISGTLTTAQSTLASTFTAPVTQDLTLGTHVYTVTIDPTVINLPIPGSPAPALIDALVTVKNVTTVTPEPSTLVLSSTALLGLGMAARRRQRAART